MPRARPDTSSAGRACASASSARAKLMKKLGVGSLVELVWMMARPRGSER